MKRTTWMLAVAALALLGGCDNTAQRRTAPAQPADASYQQFGDYEVHYNAMRTDALTPEIARSYGIQRSTNRVMLTVTVLHKQSAQAPARPVEAKVAVHAYNLNGQMKDMSIRRVLEGDAIYYIGETSIAGSEILVFDISATPSGQSAPLRVKFQREFVSG